MKNLSTAILLVFACLFTSTAFAQITGPSTVCTGSNVTLSASPAGGAWSSSAPGIASVSAAGVVTGNLAGTASIFYSLWPTPMVVTVNPTPAAIMGPGNVPCGGTVTLTDATSGGTWSSSDPAELTVSSAGVVSTVLHSGATISYTLPTGCYVVKPMTVDPPVFSPFPSVSGPSVVCAGGSITLSGTPAGGTWSTTFGLASASAATGIITGVTAGAETVQYNVPTGCGSVPFPYSITVTATATAGTIYGGGLYCGSTGTLFSTAGAGTWLSSNPSIATVGATTGLVTAMAPGTATITFTHSSSCGTATTAAIQYVYPVSAGTILGSTTVPCGSSSTFTSTLGGGNWASSAPGVASINPSTGLVTASTAGTTTISYTRFSASCGTATTTTVLTVLAASAGTISGPIGVCVGSSALLSSTVTGGVWSSGSPVLSITSGGVVTGISPGTGTITYTVATACGTVSVTKPFTVVAPGTASAISGPTSLTCGSAGTLSCAPAGGAWTSGTPGVATIISTTGVVTGVSPGTSVITYTASSATCGTATTTAVLTVLPGSAGTISGASTVCVGSSTTLSSTVTGGTWSSGSPGISMSTAGIATGTGVGTGTISYTVPTACGPVTSTMTITVLAPGSAGTISGPTSLVCGSPGTLSCTLSGGTWTSSAPGVATINSATGVITTVSVGTTTISYSALSGSCGTVTTTAVLTVLPGSAGTISGPSSVCIGGTALLWSTVAGGTWSTTSPGFSVSAAGLVTGISAGAGIITYTAATACGPVTTTAPITVLGPGTAGPISGSTSLACGSSGVLSCTPAGGTWTSSAPIFASISSSGVVDGITPGMATITYTVSTPCGTATTTAVVTVTPSTISVSGTPAYCSPNTIGVATGASFYSWVPATGVSCPSCGITDMDPATTTTYTVTGTGACGTSSATLTVSANRILGHIVYSTTSGSNPTSKVWLIQYNPADSAMVTVDSMVTCYVSDSTNQYYQFDGKPAGNYFVRAKLITAIPGMDYFPAYGASSPYWLSATGITHVAGTTDVLNVNMVYGTLPTGTGNISGYVYAGTGTTGVSGILVYLRNATTGQVLAHTYTNAVGLYAFSNVAFGSYTVYPEDYQYYTTPGAVALTSAAPDALTVHFSRFTASGTIVPWVESAVATINGNEAIMIYPNPASGVVKISWQNQAPGSGVIVVTDVTGREVYKSAVNINAAGEQAIDLERLNAGVYIINVRTEGINHTAKLKLDK